MTSTLYFTAPFDATEKEDQQNGTASNGGSQSSLASSGSKTLDNQDPKSLINSVPKPFKVDKESTQLSSPPVVPQNNPSVVQTANTNQQSTAIPRKRSDSVGSAISLSSSGSNHSIGGANKRMVPPAAKPAITGT